MNVKTNLLEEYNNFVELTKKQITYLLGFLISFVVIISLFLLFFKIKICKLITVSLCNK